MNLEILFEDRFIVASAKDAHWARCRKIDLADLIEARWVLTAPDTFGYTGVVEAFRLRGLAMPEVTVISSSVVVANHLLAKNQAVTVTSKFARRDCGASCPAHRSGSRLVARADLHVEKPYAEPGGRAIYRVRPRGGQIDVQSAQRAGSRQTQCRIRVKRVARRHAR